MIKKVLFIAIVTGFMSAAYSQDNEPSKSIMFDNDKDSQNLNLLPEKETPSLGDRCIEMKREINRLRGKPLRRSAVVDRYKTECELE